MEHRTLGGYDESVFIPSRKVSGFVTCWIATLRFERRRNAKGALAKVLLLNPDVLLLDEPVKDLMP